MALTNKLTDTHKNMTNGCLVEEIVRLTRFSNSGSSSVHIACRRGVILEARLGGEGGGGGRGRLCKAGERKLQDFEGEGRGRARGEYLDA